MPNMWLPKPLRMAQQNANGPFNPRQLSKLSGWLRLAASTAVASEWPTVVDVLNAGSPMTSSGVRVAAVGAAANGLPTAVFDGTDVHLWPQSPAHSATTKVGLWFWYKPATVAGFQTLYSVSSGVAGSTTKRLWLRTNAAKIEGSGYIDNFNGRNGATPNVLTAGAYSAIYLQYDSSRGGDANIAIFVGGVAQTLTYTNDGAGGTLGALPAASGSATIGGAADSDTPSFPIANNGVIGPNIFAFNDNLTAAEIAAILAFEAPT
jgi:hypothetical protein